MNSLTRNTAISSLAAFFLMLAPAYASAEEHTCWPANASGYLKSDQVRVFKVDKTVSHHEGKKLRSFYKGSYVGCNLKSRGWHFLYVDEFDGLPPLHGAIAGHFVALDVNYSCGACSDPPTALLLRNMQSNQQWTFESHGEGAPLGFRAQNLFLGRNGTLAYGLELSDGSSGTRTPTDRQIIREKIKDRHSTRYLLDHGLAVQPESLTLAGTTLHWLTGGTARQASFN